MPEKRGSYVYQEGDEMTAMMGTEFEEVKRTEEDRDADV